MGDNDIVGKCRCGKRITAKDNRRFGGLCLNCYMSIPSGVVVVPKVEAPLPETTADEPTHTKFGGVKGAE